MSKVSHAILAALALLLSLPWQRYARIKEKKEIPKESLQAGYELGDVNAKGVALVAAAIAALATVLIVGLAILFFWWRGMLQREQFAASVFHGVQQIPPSPQLQIDAHGDLEDVLSAQRRQLTYYSWIDPKAGWVAIPIDEAMRNWVNEHGKGKR